MSFRWSLISCKRMADVTEERNVIHPSGVSILMLSDKSDHRRLRD